MLDGEGFCVGLASGVGGGDDLGVEGESEGGAATGEADDGTDGAFSFGVGAGQNVVLAFGDVEDGRAGGG